MRRFIRNLGFDVVRYKKYIESPAELTPHEFEIIPYIINNELSMCSPQRLIATLLAVRHSILHDIPGDFVECGVYRGGNALIAAHLFKLYDQDRKVFLYDTFSGMTEPTDNDNYISSGLSVMEEFLSKKMFKGSSWAFCSKDEVENNFRKAGLLSSTVFVEGDVMQTLLGNVLPLKISTLRLDTDWYESTKKELQVLYPLLSHGGALIVDDYGAFSGAKKATDEYFTSYASKPLFNYIDYTGRIGVKCSV